MRLVLVGEGNLRLKMIPRPLSLSGAEIMAAGRVDAKLLPRYYAAADVLCAPATGRESFGIVLLEAMASQRPVVATDIPGFRGVVSHGRDGLLVEPRSPAAIAQAMIRLASDPGLAARMGEAGRRTARTYDWESVTGRLEGCFLRTLERPRKERAAPVPVRAG